MKLITVQQLSAHTAKRCPRKWEGKIGVKVAVGMNDRKVGMNGCLNVGCLRKWNADFHDHHDLSGFLAHSIMIDPSNHDDLRSFVVAANKEPWLSKFYKSYKSAFYPTGRAISVNNSV